MRWQTLRASHPGVYYVSNFFPHFAAEERVAQCDALLDLQNSTSEFQSSVNESLTVISSELESLEMRLSQAEVDIDDLQGKSLTV